LALPENHFDLWHDRAVFHFLTEERERELYLKNLRRSLKPKGHFIAATFAEDGPAKCSGLDVERYGLEKLRETVGAEFNLIESLRERHRTPFETMQSCLYAHFQLKKGG
jgi:SAM-dependent methyltransferase